MKPKTTLKLAVAGALFSILATPASADLGPLLGSGIPFVRYGDGLSFSLPIAQAYDGCTGPGCPYYVTSTPGAIKDLTVLGTGTSGNPVVTNFANMDNAYPTPSGQSGSNFFSTTIVADPVPTGTWDRAASWDSSLQAFKDFLGTSDPIFFFNNNQENSLGAAAQTLAAWARVWISAGDSNTPINITGVGAANFLFTNNDSPYAPFFLGGGGAPLDGNVAGFTSLETNPDSTLLDGVTPDPTTFSNQNTDYVLSGGQICANGTTLALEICDNSAGQIVFNHNLGANEVAYAIVFPELNQALSILFGDNPDNYELSTLAFHVDFRLGCDPGFGTANQEICLGEEIGFGKNLNNGYEQLFISTAENVTNVPEPGTLALLGGSLALLGLMRRRLS